MATPLALLLTALVMTACGGSSGGDGNGQRDPATGDPPSNPAPTLSFSASQTTVEPGSSTTLSWNAGNADSCDASGGWSGSRGPSGSEQVGPIDAETVYRLSCSGAGGGVSRQVTVAVDQGNGPTVDLRAEPTQVAVGGSSTLTWSSDGVTSCTATGGWSGSQPVSGSFTTGALNQTTSFGLSCEGPSGNAVVSVTVEVLDKVLRWQPPTENVDGSELTDLAGYVVYWGAASRSYDSQLRIEDPAVTEWTADIAPGTYYFALTAFDAQNNESGYSNEVRKTIP